MRTASKQLPANHEPTGAALTERELFDRVMDLPEGADAAAFLKSTCADESLRARVAALVNSSTLASGWMPDEPSGWPADRAAGGEEPGQMMGRYRLEKVIGQGGFGVVWLAWQQEPVQRHVAVKILKMGLDTRAVVARFAGERQALAMMDHPNVAHVYDAGATPSGRPYFVMEYLEGEPLFSYAAARRLTVADRLALLQQAAAAVQHAHQKGIIHRDLKPSNIIVVEIDGRPVPKIIDFGIAKLLSAEAGDDLTLAGQRWGTPAYMSPEQIAGAPLDTRSDVYSLGVILYELIAGAPAAERRAAIVPEPLTPSRRVTRMAPDEALTAAEQRSTTPRQLAGMLRGDLDWIVMKAAAPDPTQRYDSAGALRDDLLRFSDGRPVSAGPPAAWYRAGKFIRRHRVIFAAGSAAVLALIAGTVVSLIYARRAHEATQAMSDALYDARITEARAVRQSGRPGQRLQALASVAAAAKLRPTPELRDEALAAMALPDILPVGSLDVIPETGPVLDYDFASDLLVVGGHERAEILRYRLSTGEALGPIPLPHRLTGSFKLCLGPGGDTIAVYPVELSGGKGLPGVLTFYETSSGRKLCAIADADYECDGCEFLPDGLRAVIPMIDGSLSVVDVRTGGRERRIETGGRINQVRANAEGTRLLASRSGERTALLIDAASGAIMQPLTTHGKSVVTGFSPDGRMAAFGDESGVAVTMDLMAARDAGGTPFADLTGHRKKIMSVDFVLGSQFVVSSSWDHTVRLWNPGGQQMIEMEAGQVMADRGGRRLLVWQGRRVQLLELVPSPECSVISQTASVEAGRAAFSPDGKFIAMRVSGGTLVSAWPGARPLARVSGAHKAIRFAAGGNRLFTSGSRGLYAWDMTSLPEEGPPETLVPEQGTLIAAGNWPHLAVSRDGRWLAAGSPHSAEATERKIEILSLPSRHAVTSFPWNSQGVETLVFDPLGRWFAASWWRGRGFTVWETSDWKQVAVREPEVGSLVLAAGEDGRHLASCSSSELCVWETGLWQPVFRLAFEPVSARPRQVAIAPRGGIVAFESEPHRIRLVRIESGATMATLTVPLSDSVHQLVFSPDGNTLAVATPARTWLFDLPRMKQHLERLGLSFGQ